MKKKLMLKIAMDDEEDEINNSRNVSQSHNNLIAIQTPEKIKTDFNRGNLPELISINKLEQIKNYLNSFNKKYDYSYHWLEKSENLKIISEEIKISLNKFKEPIRDYGCEFELLKLITDDNNHKEQLITLPKSMKKFNRYSDIIPCKL